MYQPKVTNTQKYSDSQGSHIVTPAKLILVRTNNYPNKGDLAETCTKTKGEELYTDNGSFLSGRKLLPILISETEEIEEGDWILDVNINHLWQPDKKFIDLINNDEDNDQFYKVLALPEHFSDKHLQAIVDGKMKDGDEVLVKCKGVNTRDDYTQPIRHSHYKIHLDQQNHITLFPAKQSLKEGFKEYIKDRGSYGDINNTMRANDFRAGAEWAKKSNY